MAFWRGWLNIGREELEYLARYLRAWPLAMLVLGSLVAWVAAYQFTFDWSYRLGWANPADHLYLQSFEPIDNNPNLSFRWSRDESYLRFEGAGRLPSVHLEIEMMPGGRPANLPPPRVQLWETNYGRLLAEVEVRPDQPRYTFDFRTEGHKLDGDLKLTLKTLNPFQDKGHNNDLLGVVVTKVSLRAGPSDGRPVVPPMPILALLLAGLVAVYLALARAGWTIPQAAGLSGGLAGAITVGLVGYRFYLTPVVEETVLITLLAYPLLVLGLRTTGGWLGRRSLAWPSREVRWLGLIFVAAFVFKAAGLNHPAFLTVDHWFRIHQINRFWAHPDAFWQQYYNVQTGTTVTGQDGGSAVLGQWGLQLVLPYSPLFYLFAAPLSLIWPGHNDPNLLVAVNDLASWLEVSQIFLLYFIARRAWGAFGGRVGVIAAAIYGFYPLSFLLFSDGGYNTIFASWLTLLFFALLLDWLRLREAGQPSRLIATWLVLILAAALLAHTSTLLLLGATVIVITLLLLVPRGNRATGQRFALLGLAGGGLAFLLYYGWYLPGLLGTTLPTVLGKLGSGGIGQDRNLYGAKPLTGFWPQLWEHFRLWPFLFTIYDLRLLRGQRSEVRGQRSEQNQDVNRQGSGQDQDVSRQLLNEKDNSVIVNRKHPEGCKSQIVNPFLAWLIVFGLFSLLDLKVNLLQKHMLFVAPLLCLGSGLAMSLAWDWAKNHRRPGQVWQWAVGAAIVALLLFNAVEGLTVWYARVYYFVYPPGAG